MQMKVQESGLLICLVALALCPLTAAAQSFRCKTDLVSAGASRASVLQKCGEPALKDSFCKPVVNEAVAPGSRGGTVVSVPACENVDEWTYNPGYGQFMTTLRLESGKLVSIKYGDRVK